MLKRIPKIPVATNPINPTRHESSEQIDSLQFVGFIKEAAGLYADRLFTEKDGDARRILKIGLPQTSLYRVEF